MKQLFLVLAALGLAAAAIFLAQFLSPRAGRSGEGADAAAAPRAGAATRAEPAPPTESTRLRAPEAPAPPLSGSDIGAGELTDAAPDRVESEEPGLPAPELEGDPNVLVVRGSVVDGEGQPVGGADVWVGLVVGMQGAPIDGTRSDLAGRFEVRADFANDLRSAQRMVRMQTLGQEREAFAAEQERKRRGRGGGRRPAPKPSRDASPETRPRRQPATILVHAQLSGYSIGQARAPLPRDGRQPVEVTLVLRPGTTLVGIAYEKDTQLPAGGAEVMLVDGGFGVLDRTVAQQDGSWYLAQPPDDHARVFARKAGMGTGLAESLDLLAPEISLGRVELSGPGHLTGQVVYPDGEIAAEVLLSAVHEGLAFEGTVSESRRIAFERDLGIAETLFEADSFGRFQVFGLMPGRYRITFATLARPDLQPTELFAAVVGVGGGRIDLVYPAHRLRVLVQGAGVEPDDVRVSCAPLVRDEDGRLVPGVDHTAEGGGRLFAVEPGRDYVVRASAPGAGAQEAIVLVPGVPYETEVRFELIAETEERAPELVERVFRRMHSGRVRVDARGPAGERAASWIASLRAVSPGLAFAELRDVAVTDGDLLPEVPAGVWELTLRPGAEAECWLLPIDQPLEVVVRSGAETRVEARAESGGRVLLALDAELRPATARAAVDTEADAGSMMLLRTGFSASARPAAPESEEEPGATEEAPAPVAWTALTFFEPSSAAATDGARLLAGAEALCDPALAPGRWVVRVESPGLSAREVTVEIERGRAVRAPVTRKDP